MTYSSPKTGLPSCLSLCGLFEPSVGTLFHERFRASVSISRDIQAPLLQVMILQFVFRIERLQDLLARLRGLGT